MCQVIAHFLGRTHVLSAGSGRAVRALLATLLPSGAATSRPILILRDGRVLRGAHLTAHASRGELTISADEDCLHGEYAVVRASIAGLVGGKGGFGAMLKYTPHAHTQHISAHISLTPSSPQSPIEAEGCQENNRFRCLSGSVWSTASSCQRRTNSTQGTPSRSYLNSLSTTSNTPICSGRRPRTQARSWTRRRGPRAASTSGSSTYPPGRTAARRTTGGSSWRRGARPVCARTGYAHARSEALLLAPPPPGAVRAATAARFPTSVSVCLCVCADSCVW